MRRNPAHIRRSIATPFGQAPVIIVAIHRNLLRYKMPVRAYFADCGRLARLFCDDRNSSARIDAIHIGRPGTACVDLHNEFTRQCLPGVDQRIVIEQNFDRLFQSDALQWNDSLSFQAPEGHDRIGQRMIEGVNFCAHLQQNVHPVPDGSAPPFTGKKAYSLCPSVRIHAPLQ